MPHSTSRRRVSRRTAIVVVLALAGAFSVLRAAPSGFEWDSVRPTTAGFEWKSARTTAGFTWDSYGGTNPLDLLPSI